jgi:heme/copper-type cytochrome/quinol oxidase subunit 2
MKNKLLIFYSLFMLMQLMTSCEVIQGIFNAGMAVGIFVVLLVIALIIFIVVKIRRRP